MDRLLYGGITFDQSTVTLGAHTLGETSRETAKYYSLEMNNSSAGAIILREQAP